MARKKKVPLGCQGQVDCLAGPVISKAYLPNPGKSSSNKIINSSFKPQYPHTNPSVH